MKQLAIIVDGIDCSGCAVDVETALKNLEGVEKATASYVTGEVRVEYDPEEIDEKRIHDFIGKLGLKKISRQID